MNQTQQMQRIGVPGIVLEYAAITCFGFLKMPASMCLERPQKDRFARHHHALAF
ncbi:hypothetical protein HDG38_005692 [Paraburkholderia sp. WSM4177]|nr:hypothetical protein [Paraburkholderia sp. WSM4177]MBB5447055.1 hypothetical protein [Paraburkholderia sp. WSM4177]